jgi:pantoate--beta-alanine ligase
MTRVIAGIESVRSSVTHARAGGLSIGLVPTMGALHAGHASLIRAARAETDHVVVSIFVNPIQFGANEDFARYPRPLERDLELCAREKVDVVFHPEAATMYPQDFRTFVEVQGLQDVMCGPSRPGHFRGVATVVLKLLHMVQPDVAYFGQKDAQQARIIQQLVRDLDMPVRLRVCPIVREPDGLALSSRNRYLDPDQRRHAPALFRALSEAKTLAERGERDGQLLRRLLKERIEATPGAVLDYAVVVDANTLQPLERLGGEALMALAVKFGSTRLIDNVVLRL